MNYNMQISKDLLSAVQKLSSAIKGEVLNDQLINELIPDSKPLIDFYDITHFQALIFSVYMEAKLRDRDIDLERMVEIFGKNLSVLADVNVAIDELLAKKIVFNKRSNFEIRRGSSASSTISVTEAVANA